jgi:Leucine Rich repeat
MFDTIPTELFIYILSYVRYVDIIICNYINRRFRDITEQTTWPQRFFIDNNETLCNMSKKFKFIGVTIGSNVIIDDNALQYLNITSNLPFYLSGSIITDESLVNLSTNIKTLNISSCNKITDYGVSHLTNLIHLDISQNKILTNDAIKNLTNLKSLTLSNENINGEGIETLTELEELHILGHYNISNKIMMCLTKLKILVIHTRESTINFCFLEHLKKLSEITLNIDDIRGDNIEYLKRIPIIHTYKKNLMYISNLDEISNIKSLTCHQSSNSNVISTLSNLEILIFDGCSLSNEQYLQSLTNLKKLTINFTISFPEDCLSNLSNLTCLDVYCCNWITDTTLSYLDKLKSLTICSDNITNEGLKYLTNIKNLNITSCEQIDDDGLKYLSNVTILNIKYCPKITTLGISYLTNIEVLIISISQNIDYDSLLKLNSLLYIYADDHYYIPNKSSISRLKSIKNR